MSDVPPPTPDRPVDPQSKTEAELIAAQADLVEIDRRMQSLQQRRAIALNKIEKLQQFISIAKELGRPLD